MNLTVARLAPMLVLAVIACGNDGDGGDPPVFPADYAATYQEVRGCRFSLEHDLVNIRVLASPDAVTAYNGRTAPFPIGSIVLKEEYAGGDTLCEGDLVKITAMQRLEPSTALENLDWHWQEVNANQRVVDVSVSGCVRCHSACGVPPDGYLGTCTIP